jgi:hypothetical protein
MCIDKLFPVVPFDFKEMGAKAATFINQDALIQC